MPYPIVCSMLKNHLITVNYFRDCCENPNSPQADPLHLLLNSTFDLMLREDVVRVHKGCVQIQKDHLYDEIDEAAIDTLGFPETDRPQYAADTMLCVSRYMIDALDESGMVSYDNALDKEIRALLEVPYYTNRTESRACFQKHVTVMRNYLMDSMLRWTHEDSWTDYKKFPCWELPWKN